VLRFCTRDYARGDRAYERQLRHHQADVNIRAALAAEGEDMAEDLPTRGRIFAWSRRSRPTWSPVYRWPIHAYAGDIRSALAAVRTTPSSSTAALAAAGPARSR
jgi:hypothetical protein